MCLFRRRKGFLNSSRLKFIHKLLRGILQKFWKPDMIVDECCDLWFQSLGFTHEENKLTPKATEKWKNILKTLYKTTRYTHSHIPVKERTLNNVFCCFYSLFFHPWIIYVAHSSPSLATHLHNAEHWKEKNEELIKLLQKMELCHMQNCIYFGIYVKGDRSTSCISIS